MKKQGQAVELMTFNPKDKDPHNRKRQMAISISEIDEEEEVN